MLRQSFNFFSSDLVLIRFPNPEEHFSIPGSPQVVVVVQRTWWSYVGRDVLQFSPEPIAATRLLDGSYFLQMTS